MITLKEITEENYAEVLQLSVSDADKTFVAPVVRSLADCWLYRKNEDLFPYAIYAEKQLVGFLLLDLDEQEGSLLLWRLLIDQQFQGKGYGRASIEKVIGLSRDFESVSYVRVDYVKDNVKMARLLNSLSFTIFGEDSREVFTKLNVR